MRRTNCLGGFAAARFPCNLFCAHERWSVRTLRSKIAGKLYERTIAARGSADGLETELAALSATGTIEPTLAFRDPHVLDFLGLPPEHSEADLERAILDEMQRFLLELGVGFAFVERQKRMIVSTRAGWTRTSDTTAMRRRSA